MKRFLLFVFTVLIVLNGYPENKDFSRWSFSPEVGFNKFDGDVKDLNANNFTYGANLEFALTPIWGLSIDGFSLPFKGIYSNPPDTFTTKLYNANFNVTINFMRLIFPQTNSKLFINGSVGVGYAYYSYNVKILPNTNPVVGLNSPQTAGSIPISLSLEYNFSKSIALGVKARYITYTTDNLEGVKTSQGVTNDRIATGTLFLNYKLNANNKEHLRNIRMKDFEPDDGLILAKLNTDKINKFDKELKRIDKKVDEQGRRIDTIAKFLSNDGPDSDGDGVPDVRDMDPNTPPNTPVDFWGKPLNENVANAYNNIKSNSNNKNSIKNSAGNNVDGNANCCDVPAVYFDFDRKDLDDNALITISKIAKKMKEDPNLYVEVRGYCDYIGRNPYNETLSRLRAERVKAELVKIWRIPSNHIIANGKGKIIEPRIRYKPNRRCDFFFGTP
jgi:OOP family OmpA-OmpF porin